MYQTLSSVVSLLLCCILQVAGVVEYEGDHRGLAVFEYREDIEIGTWQFGGYVYTFTMREKTLDHEYGHYLQQQILGPGYLIVGVSSWIGGLRHKLDSGFTKRDYFDMTTERWATALGEE